MTPLPSESFQQAVSEFESFENENALEAVIHHPDASLPANITRCSTLFAHYGQCGIPARHVEALMFKLEQMELSR